VDGRLAAETAGDSRIAFDTNASNTPRFPVRMPVVVVAVPPLILPRVAV
jgi:hypothetical protein